MEYHLRISVSKENAISIYNAFVGRFKPKRIVSGFETIDEDGTINPHTHSYVEYNTVPTKQQLSQFFKQQKHLLNKQKAKAPCYNHRIQRETTIRNIQYCIKGEDIVGFIGFTEDELKQIRQQRLQDEEDYQKSKIKPRQRIYELYVEKYGNSYPATKYTFYKHVMEIYINVFQKMPPTQALYSQYAQYLLYNIHKNNPHPNDEAYDVLLHSLFNIRLDDTYINNRSEMQLLDAKIRMDNIINKRLKQHDIDISIDEINKQFSDLD